MDVNGTGAGYQSGDSQQNDEPRPAVTPDQLVTRPRPSPIPRLREQDAGRKIDDVKVKGGIL